MQSTVSQKEYHHQCQDSSETILYYQTGWFKEKLPDSPSSIDVSFFFFYDKLSSKHFGRGAHIISHSQRKPVGAGMELFVATSRRDLPPSILSNTLTPPPFTPPATKYLSSGPPKTIPRAGRGGKRCRTTLFVNSRIVNKYPSRKNAGV